MSLILILFTFNNNEFENNYDDIYSDELEFKNESSDFCKASLCVKSVRIWSYSVPYFRLFGWNTERYGVSFRIQSECGKIRTRITPHIDTFHAVSFLNLLIEVRNRKFTSYSLVKAIDIYCAI